MKKPILAASLAGFLTSFVPFSMAAPLLQSPIVLLPHKAVYKISLASSGGRDSLSAATGQMIYEFTGDTCEGYATRTQFVTILQTHDGATQSNEMRSNTFESADGTEMHFSSLSKNEKGVESSEGAALRTDAGPLKITLTKPKLARHEFGSSALFPAMHTAEMLKTAQKGEHLLQADFFDGSDSGAKVYATTAVIGNGIETKLAADSPAAIDGVRDVPRYPVSLSFFDRDMPANGEQLALYQLHAEMTGNGVTTKLRMDYPEFSLNAVLQSLEVLPVKACKG